MNNNQFRAFIRDYIEALCEDRLKIVYIDTSCNNRIYYVYDSDHKIKGTINVWTGNYECSVMFSKNIDKPVSLANYEIDCRVSYMQLDKILNTLKSIIVNLKGESK